MAHFISANLQKVLDDSRNQEIMTIVKVFWNTGVIHYSEQEAVIDTFGLYSFPALLSISGMSIAQKINGNGSSSTCNISLDDADGHIKDILNQQNINGTYCEIYLSANGLYITDALRIFTGNIIGESIAWEDKDRILNFSLSMFNTSKSLNFVAYEGMIPNTDKDFSKKYWNFGFGQPKGVEFLQYKKTPMGLTAAKLRYVGGGAGNNEYAFLITEMEGFELDTDYTFDFLNSDTLLSGVLSPVTGRIYEFDGGIHILVPNSINPELYNSSTISIIDRDPASPYFADFRYWWVSLNSGTDNLTGKALFFDNLGDRPSLISHRILSHVGNRIELDHQPRWGSPRLERAITGFHNYKLWYSNFSVSSSGKVQGGIKIASVAHDPRYAWKVRAIQYYRLRYVPATLFAKETVKKDTEDKASIAPGYATLVREYIRQNSQTPGNPSLFVTSEVDPQNSNITNYITTFLPENEDKTLADNATYGWSYVDYFDKDKRRKSGFKNESEAFVGTGSEKTAVVVIAGETSSKYILNIFPSVLDDSEQLFTTFSYESRVSRDKLIPLPDLNITINNESLIPEEDIDQTTVVVDPSVSLDPDNKRSGRLFGDLPLAAKVHDGRGGFMQIDTSNPVEVISWLYNVYTDLKMDTSSPAFTSLRANKFSPMAFVINSPTDAKQLAETIAWEHKLAIRTFADQVNLIQLDAEPVIEYAFTPDNVELRTIVKSYVSGNDIITQFRFKYKERKNETEDTLMFAFNNNVVRYGENKQDIDIVTLDNDEAVFELVKFWGNRLSRAWRIISFSAKLEAIKLQPFDAVSFNIPIISSNTVTGFVHEISFDPDNFRANITCVLASESGVNNEDFQITDDPSYWLGLTNLVFPSDTRVGIVSELDGIFKRRFTDTTENTLKPFQRKL